MAADHPPKRRVAYLVGAGATHACAKAVNSPHGLLMTDLNTELAERVRVLIAEEYPDTPSLLDLANDVINATCDYEHVITFLDESVSELHRRFATDLRKVFEDVLKKRLDLIEKEHGAKPNDLYATLLDLHELETSDERLLGLLTLNYDDYIESAAVSVHGKTLDLGIAFDADAGGPSIRLLKLHGSFSWTETWPITIGATGRPLWIPPGIQKAKNRYPFNLIWGRARELLDCDVLRVIGCRLSPNDWDLISMLFSTRLARSQGRAYEIEIIDSPNHAEDLQKRYPYLSVRSLFQLERIGKALIGEFLGTEASPYDELSEHEKSALRDLAKAGCNWFSLWLKLKAEDLYSTLGTVDTKAGRVAALLDRPS